MQDLSALSAPFSMSEIKFKPQMVKGNRALPIAYITSRTVMNRLDAVVGPFNWQDSYHVLNDGSVVCTLEIFDGTKWVRKQDVGGQSEQPDEGDRMKSAFSDALKRAAVKFGIGRYIYEIKMEWHDYDPAKKQFTTKPTLNGAPVAAQERQQQSKQQPAAQRAERQQPATPATHEQIGKLLTELAGLRGISPKKMFETFMTSFEPEVKTLTELAPTRFDEAIRQLKMKIDKEKDAISA